MKRNLFPAAVCLASILFLSALPFQSLAAQISDQTAKAIALGNCGIKEEDTSWIHVKTEYDDGRQICEVKFFTKAYAEYKYELLAEDGSILSIEYDAGAVITENQDALKKDTSITTLEHAKEASLLHSKTTAEEVTFTKTSSEMENGRQIYDIEFYTTDSRKYDFEIDAKTGIILDWKYEAAKIMPSNDGNTQTVTSSADGVEQAKAAALAMAGLSADQVTWGRVHADYDDGRSIYEGKFFYGRMEYEFEVDAATMTVIDWDVDDIYD